MKKPVWSFIEGIEVDGRQRRFSLSLQRENLARIGYPPSLAFIPKGLLIEGCAQACGLSLFLDDPDFPSLPLLARVNRGSFFRPLTPGMSLSSTVRPVHLSDDGALFECECFQDSIPEVAVSLEILLGFLPFRDLPGGGRAVRDRLREFVATFPI